MDMNHDTAVIKTMSPMPHNPQYKGLYIYKHSCIYVHISMHLWAHTTTDACMCPINSKEEIPYPHILIACRDPHIHQPDLKGKNTL